MNRHGAWRSGPLSRVGSVALKRVDGDGAAAGGLPRPFSFAPMSMGSLGGPPSPTEEMGDSSGAL